MTLPSRGHSLQCLAPLKAWVTANSGPSSWKLFHDLRGARTATCFTRTSFTHPASDIICMAQPPISNSHQLYKLTCSIPVQSATTVNMLLYRYIHFLFFVLPPLLVVSQASVFFYFPVTFTTFSSPSSLSSSSSNLNTSSRSHHPHTTFPSHSPLLFTAFINLHARNSFVPFFPVSLLFPILKHNFSRRKSFRFLQQLPSTALCHDFPSSYSRRSRASAKVKRLSSSSRRLCVFLRKAERCLIRFFYRV